MDGGEAKLPRNCGSHCPEDNVSRVTTKKCRLCKKPYHLPCYGISHAPAKLFFIDNIVFVCDACLMALDEKKSPSPNEQKTGSKLLKQSMLSPCVNGNVTLQSKLTPTASNTGTNSKKPTNEQLFAWMSTISDKLDKQTKKINEINIGVNEKIIGRLDEIGPFVIEIASTSKAIDRKLDLNARTESSFGARDLAK